MIPWEIQEYCGPFGKVKLRVHVKEVGWPFPDTIVTKVYAQFFDQEWQLVTAMIPPRELQKLAADYETYNDPVEVDAMALAKAHKEASND